MRSLILTLTFVGISFACPGEGKEKAHQHETSASAVAVSQANGIPISVDGISCSHCVEEVKNALLKLDEVKDVSYDAKKDLFYIVLKDGYKLDEQKIKDTIEKAGYHYKGIKQMN